MYDLHDRQVQLDQLEIRRHAPGQAHKALPDSDPPKSLQYADESFQLSATSVSPSFAPLSTGVTAEPELLLSDASAPIKLTTVRLPNMHTLNRTFAHMFVGPRYHEKPTGKRRFQRLLRDQLAGAGYELIEQNFRVRHLQLSSPKSMAGKVMNQVGTNLIAILPGRHSAQAHQLASWASRERRHTPETLAGWRMSSKLLELLNFVRENKIDKRFFASPNVSTQPGHTPEVTNDQPATSGNESLHGDESSHAHPQRVRAPESDGVIVIGAHYDTVETCPGVNDNGSGSILLLELARALAPLRYKLKHSIMFVWFDFEEAVCASFTLKFLFYFIEILFRFRVDWAVWRLSITT